VLNSLKKNEIVLYNASKGPLLMKNNPRNRCEKGKETGLVRIQIDYMEMN